MRQESPDQPPRADEPPPSERPERRRHARRPTPGLAGRIGFLQPLRVVDLSAQGARVRTGEALSPGKRYHVQVATLQLTASVARCALVQLEPDDEGGRSVFEAGLTFDPMTPAQRKTLWQAGARAARGTTV